MVKKETHPTVVVNDAVKLCEGLFTIIFDVVNLAVLETKLAGKSLLKIIGLMIFLFLFGITAWISAMMALTIFITLIYPNLFVSLLAVTFLNIAIIAALYLRIIRCRADLNFSATRFHAKLNQGSL